ncbi:MAG TPA: DUF5317 family protein [Actinomycetota bacterium]|nr:DUF5317 family protein [Actinomycetota bacterium]
MILLGAIVVAAMLLAFGLGGRLRNLADPDVRVRWWPILPLSLALQVAPIPQVGTGVGRYLPVVAVLVSYLILGVVLVANIRLRGFVLILLGSLLNVVVIAANQGMPVSRAAIVESENISLLEGLPTERGHAYHAATEGDVLLPLADVIPVRQPFGVVVSVGDVFTYSGTALFLAAAMLGRPRRRSPRRDPVSREPATTSGTQP